MEKTKDSQLTTDLQNLQNNWNSTVPTLLGLDPKSFHFVTLTKPFDMVNGVIDTRDVYQLCNMLHKPGGINPWQVDPTATTEGFYDVYKNMVENCIQFLLSDGLRRALGDNYSEWVNKRSSFTAAQNNDYNYVWSQFNSWASNPPINLDTSTINSCKQYFDQEFKNPVVTGKHKLDDQNNYTNGIANYTPTNTDLSKSITSAASKEFSIGSGKVQLKGSFNKMLTATLTRGNWYNSPTLSYAYNTTDNTVWIAGASLNWDNTFGDSGTLQNITQQFTLVDGLDATLTVKQGENGSEEKTIKENIKNIISENQFFSVFFQHIDIEVKQDDENLICTLKALPGNPTLLGINTILVADLFS